MFFHFIFSFISSTKSENRRAEQSCPGGRRKVIRKRSRRGNMVQKMCTCNVSAKMILVETTQESGEGEIRENGRGGKFIYDILDAF
jgi:hypothetical protein